MIFFIMKPLPHWTQHGSNTHAHAAQSDVYNYYCPELAASASSQHQCTAGGSPTCSTQMVDIGISDQWKWKI